MGHSVKEQPICSFSFLLALSPWPWLMPRLKPIPTTDTVTLLDTDTPDTTVLDTDTVLDTAATDTVLVATTEATTARGPLMPSPQPSPPPPLRPRLIPTTDTTAMDTTVLDTAVPTVSDTDTDTISDTDTDTATTVATTARGPLMPSPPLMLMPRLIPTTDTTAMDTTVLDTVLDTAVPTDTVLDTAATATATATDTTVKCPDDSSQPKTSLGTTSSEKWIAQFGSIPTSATSFSATRLAQARNGEQEAKENQNVMIRRIKKSKP